MLYFSLSISFHEWTISRIYVHSSSSYATQSHTLTVSNTNFPFPSSRGPTSFQSLGQRQREREKSFEPGLSKGSRGLVGGWQGCYDVLRCAVATKTMRLVTVIVRNVGLCAVTDPVHRPRLRFQPFLLRFPSLDPLQWQAPLHSVAIMERTLIYFRASHDSFWIFFDENFYYAPPGLINGLARANVCTIFIARLDSWNIANIFDTLILGILFLSDAERLRVFFLILGKGKYIELIFIWTELRDWLKIDMRAWKSKFWKIYKIFVLCLEKTNLYYIFQWVFQLMFE